DLGQLAVVETAGLRQDLRPDVHLADVVEGRAQPERLDLRLVPAEPERHGLRVRADPGGVRAEVGVADLHGGREGAESAHGTSGSRRGVGTLPVDSGEMRVCVPRESAPGENRVALTPEAAAKLASSGFEVVVERGACVLARFAHEQYAEGNVALADRPSLLVDAAVVVRVAKPNADEVAALPSGAVLIGFLEPLTDPEGIARLRDRGVVAFAMEAVPRITRAQSMDALSSQATVAVYKGVLLGADRCPKLFPMLMTAAGTVAPARVLVLGAGVTGLPGRPQRPAGCAPASRACRRSRRHGGSARWSRRSTSARRSPSRSSRSARRSSTWACAGRRRRAGTRASSRLGSRRSSSAHGRTGSRATTWWSRRPPCPDGRPRSSSR